MTDQAQEGPTRALTSPNRSRVVDTRAMAATSTDTTATADPATPGTAATTGGTTSGKSRLPRPRMPRTLRTGLDLLVAVHPRQLVLTALGVAGAAFLAGRPMTEVWLVLATVALGQAVLGWHNDIVDRTSDAREERPRKPVASGRLDHGTVWFALACAVLALVPLAVANGLTAGSAYVGSVVIALLGNLVLRGSVLSWAPWAASYALYPFFLSYGGLGGSYEGGGPPNVAVVVLAAALGVCVHVLRALPGLVPDNRSGRRHLPLRLAIRTGAPRLLLLAGLATAAVLAGLAFVAATSGLTR